MKKLGEQGVAKEKVEKDKAMFGGQEIKGKTLSVVGLGKYNPAILGAQALVWTVERKYERTTHEMPRSIHLLLMFINLSGFKQP